MNLQTWQQSFTGAIDEQSESSFINLLSEVPGPDFSQGLEVYRNNYLGSRVSVIEDIYPVCRRVLGEDCFNGLARQHVKQTESRQYDLNLYGGEFETLLQTMVRENEAFKPYPWLPGLARLEWLCHRVFYLPDRKENDVAAVAGLEPEKIVIKKARHIDWMASDWPVLKIWLAHQEENEPEALNIEPAREYLLIEREGFRPVPITIEQSVWHWLEQSKSAQSLEGLLMNDILQPEYLTDLLMHGWLELEA